MQSKITFGKVTKLIVLSLCTVLSLYPIIWVILSSFKSNDELLMNVWGLPQTWRIQNYVEAWTNSGIGRAFLNSLIVSCSSLAILLVVSTMAAFALTRLRFKGRTAMQTAFIIIMMIPLHATLIPLFLMFSKIKLTNTYLSLILPYVTFGLPVAIFILCGFMRSFPDSLEESAIMDGASMVRVFFSVTVPVCRPAIATVAIYSFITMWNELLYSVVFMSNRKMATIPVALTMFKGMYTVDYVSMLAAIAIAIGPSLLIYVFFNKQIIAGMTSGAIKG